MASSQRSGRLEAWWGIVKAIAYELRPFTIPSKDDLKNAAKALEINAKQLWAEGRRLAPKILETTKSVNPLRALSVLAWLCGWALFTWIEFGAVYFIVSAMAMVFINLGEREEGEWSAYSVFNAGCRALLGTLKAEHFEREIMHQDPGGPALQHHPQEDEFVWVEPPARIHDDGDNDEDDDENSNDDEEEEDYDDGGNGVEGMAEDGDDVDVDVGHDAGVVRRTRRVSGKRARRGFEERRERREERRQALAALVPEEWE